MADYKAYGVTESEEQLYADMIEGIIEKPTPEQRKIYRKVQKCYNEDPGPAYMVFTIPELYWKNRPYRLYGTSGQDIVMERKVDGKLFKATFTEVDPEDVVWGNKKD